MKNIFSKIQRIEKLPARLKNLYNHYIIRDIAFGLLALFGPIFLFKVGNGLRFVIWIFLLTSLLYVLFLPLWAKLLKLCSLHIFLIIGTLFSAAYFFSFYLLSQNSAEKILFFVCLLVLFDVLYRLFYWIPYHVDFARFLDQHHHGRRLSYLSIIISLLGVALPIFAGFVIVRFGFDVLFIFAVFMVLVALIPAFFIHRTRESYAFGYWETFRKMFAKKHIKTNLAYAADGWQSGIGCIIWPVFIFLLLDGQYLQVGLISGLIVLVACIIKFFIGEATDKFDRKKLIKTGSVLYALGWVFKAIASSAFHIFLAGVYHDFTSVLVHTPFDAMGYEIAADQGHYVDEFSVIREMSLHFGRVIMLVSALVLISFVNMVWIFVLGAVVSLFLNLVTKEEFIY